MSKEWPTREQFENEERRRFGTSFNPRVPEPVDGDETTTTPVDLAELQKLCTAATSGPWSASGLVAGNAYLRGGVDNHVICSLTGPADVAFMAATSPDVVLGLINQLQDYKTLLVGDEDAGSILRTLVSHPNRCRRDRRTLDL